MKNNKTPAASPEDLETSTLTADIETDPSNLDWLEEFGTPANLISIRLHRYKEGAPVNNQGFHPFVCSYEQPPTLDLIKSEHGGGNYMLVVKYKDERTENGKGMKKTSFIIEGPPKVYTDSPVNGSNSHGNAPPLSANGQGDILTILTRAREAGLIPAGPAAGSDNTALIMKAIENTNNMMFELFKTFAANKSGDNSGITEILLKSALEKSNRTELDDFEKYMNILDKLKGESGEGSEVMQLVKSIAPGLFAAFMQRKPAQPQIMPAMPPQMNGAPAPGKLKAPPAVIPHANPTEIEELEKLRAENQRLQFIQNFSLDVLDDIEAMIDADQNPAAVSPLECYKIMLNKNDVSGIEEFNFYLDKLGFDPIAEVYNINEINNINNLNENTDMFGMFSGFNLDKFIQGLKDAQFNERVITLKQASNMFNQEQIYNFCLKHEIVSDVEDFNRYMTAANLPLYNPVVTS
jgi:hypothetical protein